MKKITLAILGVGLLASCNQQPLVGDKSPAEFSKTETGLAYQIHSEAPKKGIQMHDAIVFHMLMKSGEMVLRDTYKEGMPLTMVLDEIPFKGSLEEGLMLISEGDSATFLVNADSLYTKSFGMAVPPEIKKGSAIQFDVLVEKVLGKDEVKKDLEIEHLQIKLDNENMINEYLRGNKILDVERTSSGLYIASHKKGNGKKPEEGQMVAIHYTGKLLNGKIFGSSRHSGEPLFFTLGKDEVLPGWEEGIMKLSEGSKATLIIPSHLAYGEEGADQLIPPNSPLVYDVEVVKVNIQTQ
ncbi:MAG: FKBP-type peptidyl-prolyl cis-trans isomerase [Cytophagaceae bacterium]